MFEILVTTFMWSVLGFVFTFILGLTGDARFAVLKAIAVFIAQFVIMSIMYHLFMPAMVGLYFGYGNIIATWAVLNLLINLMFADIEGNGAKLSGTISGLVLLAMVFVHPVAWLFATIGSENAKTNASFANIEIASKDVTLPPTDPNNIPLVTRTMADTIGQRALPMVGPNASSMYQIHDADYVLQSVGGHLYWIAPLTYRSWSNQYGLFGNQKADIPPGFVAVDAEDPNAMPQVHTEHAIKLSPQGSFEANLKRHVYYNGYTNVKLEDPTIEVDDNWVPYYTVTAIVPSRVVRGDVIKKVLLVNATTGEIKPYEVKDVPRWVDRVMSERLVSEYVDEWGKWGNPRSLAQYPNFGMQDEMMADEAGIELVYNNNNNPVYVIPMTSRHNGELSCYGVILYDTNKNKATYYPGLSGKIAIGQHVIDAIEQSPQNRVQKYKVAKLSLTSIESVPTWVAVLEQDGGSFGGMAMLDARSAQGSDVVIARDKNSALIAYSNYLANSKINNATVGSQSTGTTTSGKICRLGNSQSGGDTTYQFTLCGQSQTFSATLKAFAKMPLVREGDAVVVRYMKTTDTMQPVMQLTDEQVK